MKGEKVPGGECSGGRANHGSRGGENARGEKVSGGRKCVSQNFSPICLPKPKNFEFLKKKLSLDVRCPWVKLPNEHMRHNHALPTPNEGIIQVNLKIWADVVDKICFGPTKKSAVPD